jgi:hypothetical protein
VVIQEPPPSPDEVADHRSRRGDIIMDRDEPGDGDTQERASSMTRRELLTAFGGGAVLARRKEGWGRMSAGPSRAAAKEWHYMSLTDMAKLIETKEVSPVEVTRPVLSERPVWRTSVGRRRLMPITRIGILLATAPVLLPPRELEP